LKIFKNLKKSAGLLKNFYITAAAVRGKTKVDYNKTIGNEDIKDDLKKIRYHLKGWWHHTAQMGAHFSTLATSSWGYFNWKRKGNSRIRQVLIRRL
jgi:hypothetical protein